MSAAIWSFAPLSIKPTNDNLPIDGSFSSSVAKIAAILPNEHWINPVGMTMAFWFQVNIYNNDSKALKGLTLNLTITNVSADLYNWGTYEPIGTIQPGETLMVQVYVLAGLDRLNQVSGNTAVVQLLLDDKILDEGSLILPKWG